jgi:hypothetical protein
MGRVCVFPKRPNYKSTNKPNPIKPSFVGGRIVIEVLK